MMKNKLEKNKKGVVTFTSLAITIILVLTVFFVYFDFIQNVGEDNDYQNLPVEFTNASSNFTGLYDQYEKDSMEWSHIVKNISEPSGVTEVLSGVFRGMRELFILPFTLGNYAVSMVEITFGLTGALVSPIIKTTVIILITLIILLLVAGLFSGGNNRM